MTEDIPGPVLMAGRLQAVTVVTPDLERSISYYTEALGYALLGRGALGNSAPMRDHMPLAGRAYAFVRAVDAEQGTVRLLQAPPGAVPNRPRPDTQAWDSGLAVLEFATSDPDASYAKVTGWGAPTLSPPLPYAFADAGVLGAINVRSYAAFGPAGEEMFITRSVGPKRPPLNLAGLHGAVGNIVLPNRNRAPVLNFYESLFGIVPTVDAYCRQETVNQIIGAPADTSFQMIMLGPPGGRVGIEVEEYAVESSASRPTSLNRTGLAMATFRVTDLTEARERCRRHGFPVESDSALPLPDEARPEGFIVRGALGELIEVLA